MGEVGERGPGLMIWMNAVSGGGGSWKDVFGLEIGYYHDDNPDLKREDDSK